jgi:hypothetical protein
VGTNSNLLMKGYRKPQRLGRTQGDFPRTSNYKTRDGISRGKRLGSEKTQISKISLKRWQKTMLNTLRCRVSLRSNITTSNLRIRTLILKLRCSQRLGVLSQTS